MRVGHGFDVHAFGPGDGLVVGGVRIPFERGVVAHSDGDVLVHALCDALLGALARGDIGRHFPDTDPRWKDCDSRQFLREIVGWIHAAGLELANADATIIAEAPRFAPHIDHMRKNLAADLQVAESQVNVKATTTEGLGFTGRREGIAAHAVVLLLAR